MPSGWMVLPSLPRAEHQIPDLIVEDGLLALGGVEGVDQREALVVLAAEWANRLSVQRVLGWLRSREARCHHAVGSRDRHVDREVMAAELDQPRGRLGRRAEEREVVLVLAEDDAATAASSATSSLRWTAGPLTRRYALWRSAPRRIVRRRSASTGTAAGAPAAGVLQDLVAVHDLVDLLVSRRAQCSRHQSHGRIALRRREVAEPESFPLEDAAWQIGPAGPLRAVELEGDLASLLCGERRQQGVRSADDLRRHTPRRCSRGLILWWADTRQAAGNEGEGNAETEPRGEKSFHAGSVAPAARSCKSRAVSFPLPALPGYGGPAPASLMLLMANAEP